MKHLKRYFVIYLLLVIVMLLPHLLYSTFISRLIVSSGQHWVLFALYGLRILCIMAMFTLVLTYFYQRVIRGEMGEQAKNRWTLWYSTCLFLLLMEAVFMFIPQSQGNVGDIGLGQQVWHTWYYRPINELGYRDDQIAGKERPGKMKFFFIGDSFTFGNGIAHAKDRFSNLVANAEKPVQQFDFYNLGRGNAGTIDELKNLQAYPVKPDVVLLQYYMNDIDDCAKANEKHTDRSYKEYAVYPIAFAATSTYFGNFVLVNVLKYCFKSIFASYPKHMQMVYRDEQIINCHLQELSSFIEYTSANHIKTYVLLIPNIPEPSLTDSFYRQRLTPFLAGKGINVIDISAELEHIPAEKRVVNDLDSHAGETVQQLIANKVLKTVTEFEH